MIGEDAKELPVGMFSRPVHKHIKISVTRIEQAHARELGVESALIGTAREPPIRPAMPRDQHLSDSLVIDLACRMQYRERFLDKVPKPVLVFKLAAPGIARIPRPFRKNEYDILPARSNLLTQFVLRNRLPHVVAPAMQI